MSPPVGLWYLWGSVTKDCTIMWWVKEESVYLGSVKNIDLGQAQEPRLEMIGRNKYKLSETVELQSSYARNS